MMNKPIQTEEYKGYTIEIYQDDDYPDPYENNDPVAKWYCFHNRYSIGEKHNHDWRHFSDWEAFKKKLLRGNPGFKAYPIYMLDHSGLKLSLHPFGDSWDSGQIGWAIMTEDGEVSHLEADIDEYNNYLSGEVYGYKIIKDEGNCGSCGQSCIKEVDSCWGFIGSTQDCVKYAKEHIDVLVRNVQELVVSILEEDKTDG